MCESIPPTRLHSHGHYCHIHFSPYFSTALNGPFANSISSETTSIPTNPRTTRPVGYAFVDVSTPSEAERAISELNGKTILDRKVSVQLARKPEPAQEGTEGAEPARRRSSTRGRGRGRGRGGRSGRGRVSLFSLSRQP